MAEDDRRARAPVLVEDLRAIGGGDRAHALPPLVRERPASLFDEVGVVDHACALTAPDADEDALVEPVQRRRCGFDLRRRAERVLAGVDLLAASETGED